MITSRRSRRRAFTFCGMSWAAGITAAWLCVGASMAHAGVSAVAEPPIPASPNVATTDPFAAPAGGNVGLADTRMLRQTFKNAATFNIGQIIVAFDVGSGIGGFAMAIYEVDDVNGSNWTATVPSASPIHSWSFPGNLPGTTQRLGFTLTGTDVFTLPARFAGTTGYGIEFTTVDQVNNPGQFRHANTASDAVDLYPDGKYYIQTGGSTNGNRDFGLWMTAVDPNAPGPGDVDGLNGVDLADLNIIAAHFRQSAIRANGDLSGDGFVDITDFREWKTNYSGAGAGADYSFLGSVPEPGTFVLAVTILAVGGMTRRRTPTTRSGRA